MVSVLPSSALAVASAVRSATSAQLSFSARFHGDFRMHPSVELLAICNDHLRDFNLKLQHSLHLTIYSRTPECYGTDALEFRQIAPGKQLLLHFTSDVKPCLQEIEVFLAQTGALELPDFNALVVPLARELCLVGLVVAERASRHANVEEKAFTVEDTGELVRLARPLALACIMDQRAALLQHASWQKSVKIENLLEQARGSLTAMRTLGKMLLPQLKRGEISRDVLQDMLVQGEHMNGVLEQALYVSLDMGEGLSAEDTLAAHGSSQIIDTSPVRVALAPPDDDTGSCNAADIVSQIAKAGTSMASKMKLKLVVSVDPGAAALTVCVEENRLRQALRTLVDNAIQGARGEGGEWVRLDIRKVSAGVILSIQTNIQGLDTKAARSLLEGLGVVLRVTAPAGVELLLPSKEDKV